MSAGVFTGQKRAMDQPSQELELQAIVSCPVWVQGRNSNHLQEQQKFLTTEPSLQPLFFFFKQMLCIVILSFILSLMFFKLKRLENCGFAQLDWLLVTISVNAISTVIKFDLSGLHEACVGK